MIAKKSAKSKKPRPLAPGQELKQGGMFSDAFWDLGTPEGLTGALNSIKGAGVMAGQDAFLKRALAWETSKDSGPHSSAVQEVRLAELSSARKNLDNAEDLFAQALEVGVDGRPASLGAIESALRSAALCGWHIARYQAYFSSPRWNAKKGSGRPPKLSPSEVAAIETERERTGGKHVVAAHTNDLTESGWRGARKRNRRQ